jgi:hypothetical protein
LLTQSGPDASQPGEIDARTIQAQLRHERWADGAGCQIVEVQQLCSYEMSASRNVCASLGAADLLIAKPDTRNRRAEYIRVRKALAGMVIYEAAASPA